MANRFFIPDFRGAGSPGARPADATEKGLQLVAEGKHKASQRGLELQGEQDDSRIDSLVKGAIQLKQIQDPERKIEFIKQRINQLKSSGIDSGDSEELLGLAESGDFEGVEAATDQAIQLGERLSRQGSGASAKAFAPQTIRKVVGQDEEGNDVFKLFSRQMVFDPKTQTSKATETPIEGDLVTATGETVSQKRMEEIKTVRSKEEAKAIGKAKGEAKSAPLIAKTKAGIVTAVKLAEKASAAKGETFTDLKRAKAALPALRESIAQLKELAPIATSTLGGRAFDIAVKEGGFGSTKGANARAKFIAIINNQVLPLLKPTFGAAFTETEGASLRATMGDPDATPDQKIIQLNSFIDQKAREIQSKQREVGEDVTLAEELTSGSKLFSTALNREVTEQDITDTLQANQGLTREQILEQLDIQ